MDRAQMVALVVDDSRAMRTMIRRLLEGAGLHVLEAQDGKEALEILGVVRPRALLVDWNLPGMNGLELVEAVRVRPDYETTRILMVTSERGAAQRCRAISAGADEYLMKPFAREAVVEKLQMLGVMSA